MLKGQKKHVDKEQGKTKHETPCSVNYRAIQNKNNIGTTALELKVSKNKGSILFQSVCEAVILHIAFLYSWTDRKKWLPHFLAVEIKKNNVWEK